MALSKFADRIYKYCTDKDLLVGVSCIVAGLSGGPDSVALVSVLAELHNNIEGFPAVYAVHVNHGLREEASYDETLSADLCRKLDVPFRAFHFDVKAKAGELGRGLEETGRILRYRAFDETSDEAAASLSVPVSEVKISTAHHLGDLTETFMMNLFRGTGLEGLTVMNRTGNVIRPFLEVTKEEILEYLDGQGLAYATDVTNLQSDYTRNKWRNEIFPLIAEASVKNPMEAVSDTYKLLCEDEDYLFREALSVYGSALVKEGRYRFIKVSKIADLHPAVRNRVIRLCWKDTFGNLTDFETKHVDIVNELMTHTDGTHYADLPFGRRALCVGGLLGFYGQEGAEGISCAMASFMGYPAIPGKIGIRVSKEDLKDGKRTFILPDSALAAEASIVENNESIVYNTFSWICPGNELEIGTISEDRDFQKAGSLHKTDLNKIMSDLKIPRDSRNHLVAVRSGGRILWIPGVGHSEGFVSPKSRQKWLEDGDRTKDQYLIRLEIVRKGDAGGQV